MIPRNRRLDDLAPIFRPLVNQLLAGIVEAGIAVFIVETRRSAAQHAEDLASGHSWVERSKHQDGLAIDLAPFEIYVEHGDKKANWNVHDPNWLRMGMIGEAIGLGWGGRWMTHPDLGHFELTIQVLPGHAV